MGLSLVSDDDEWLELLNGNDVDELLEESPPKKKPHLCLSLKKKESRTSRVFEDSTNISHSIATLELYLQLVSILFDP